MNCDLLEMTLLTDLDIVIDQIDAQNALEFVEAILMYVFSLTRKFEEFKNRRVSKQPEKVK